MKVFKLINWPNPTWRKKWPEHLLGDLLGGLLAAIIALPLSLAFGIASGLGAAAGLYGAIACGFLAALCGGTPTMVSGPTGPVTVGVAAVALLYPDKPQVVFAAAVAAGIFQIVLGRLKVGQLVLYIPHPVVSGFMTGIGVIIISLQLLPLCGLKTKGDIFDTLQAFTGAVQHPNVSALILGLTTIAIIYLARSLRWKFPPLLVALVCTTAASIYFNLDVPRIGTIPSGLPSLVLPTFSLHDIRNVLMGGLTIAILGAMDSLLTAVLIDKVIRTRHNSDRELFGQGIGNIFAGLFGGLPGSGTTMPSIVNIGAGGFTRLSAVFSSFLLLFVLLGFGNVAALIPLPVLAGILITVGISIMDKKSLMAMRTAQKSDVAVMLIVLVLTVFVDLIIAVCIGVALASTLFAKRMADLQQSSTGRMETLEQWRQHSEELPEHVREHLFISDFVGPLFFGEVRNFLECSPTLETAECVILRFNNVPFIDQSGAYALEDAIENWKKRSIRVLFVGINTGIKTTLEDIGFSFDESNFFTTIQDAVLALAKDCADEEHLHPVKL